MFKFDFKCNFLTIICFRKHKFHTYDEFNDMNISGLRDGVYYINYYFNFMTNGEDSGHLIKFTLKGRQRNPNSRPTAVAS